MAKKNPPVTTPEVRLKKAASDLKMFHDRLLTANQIQLSPAQQKRKKTLDSQFEAAHESIRASSAPEKPEPVEITKFFTRVAQGLVTAQQNLDDQSKEYLMQVAAQPHALPAIFRIPKVSAEMKFAVDTTATTGVNLIFYKDQNQAHTLNQQTVTFDIVSAPPPPGFVMPPAAVTFVRLKSDRAQILTAIGASLSAAILADFDRVLILQIVDTTQPAPPNRQYLLGYANSANSLGIWWLQVTTGTPAQAVPVLPFGSATAALASLRVFFSTLGDHQKAFLATLP